MRAPAFVSALAVATLLLASGAGAQILRGPETYQVVGVKERNGYLDTVLKNEDRELRFFFPAASEDCAFLMKVENVVTWSPTGPFGKLTGGDDRRCDPMGIGSLQFWRDRQPRGREGPAPRGRASFEVTWQDEEYAMALGRFPYANRTGFGGSERAIALVPRSEPCLPILERGEASLEFRRPGDPPYRLVTPDGICPIEAFLTPQVTRRRSPESR